MSIVQASRSTHIGKLDDEVPPLCVGEDGEHVLAGLAVALAHQEVALLLEQLLGLGPGDGAMVPLLLPQGFLTGGDHVEELAMGRGEESRTEERPEVCQLGYLLTFIFFRFRIMECVNSLRITSSNFSESHIMLTL